MNQLTLDKAQTAHNLVYLVDDVIMNKVSQAFGASSALKPQTSQPARSTEYSAADSVRSE